MTINVKDTGNFPAPLREKTTSIIEATRQCITRVALLLGNKAKRKLSDDVLKVRTGRLRRSITHEVRQEGDQIIGIVGTNVNYAAAHEFGVDMDQEVKAHVRIAKQAFGRMLKEPVEVNVRAHRRHMVIPERSFLRSSLLEMKDQIPEELKAAVTRT